MAHYSVLKFQNWNFQVLKFPEISLKFQWSKTWNFRKFQQFFPEMVKKTWYLGGTLGVALEVANIQFSANFLTPLMKLFHDFSGNCWHFRKFQVYQDCKYPVIFVALEIYGNLRKFTEISLKFTEISGPPPWSWNFRTLRAR